MPAQNLSNVIVALKVQGALGTAASGSGATGLEVLPSQGIAMQVAAIQTQLLKTTRMRGRTRQGSRFVTAGYETELQVGAADTVMEGVLGGTWAASQTLTEATLTDCTITGTGVTITFSAGSVLAAGVRVGMMAKFANLSVAANNDVWFPILAISANGRVLTVPSGYLVDNTADNAFDLIIAKSVYTADPYTDRLFTLEEYLADIDRSKLATDQRLNSLSFTCQPDQPLRIGFGMGGRDMDLLESGSSPNFTSPAFISGKSLVLLDGGVFINGTKRLDLTGFTWGLTAPVSGVPLIASRISPDAFLGQFELAGNFTGVVEDGAVFDDFNDEAQLSVLLHCKEQTTQQFVSFYLGDLAFGGWTTPAGGEGAMIQTAQLFGGEDVRGGAFARTSVLVSTSAA